MEFKDEKTYYFCWQCHKSLDRDKSDFLCWINHFTKISLHLAAFRKMVENNECVICKCSQDKAQIAIFGQSGQFNSSEPLVIRPNWFKKVTKVISKKARKFLTK